MTKYLKDTKGMSLDEKISWVIDRVPHILLNDMNIDISDVNDIVDNDDTICILQSEHSGDEAAKKAIKVAIDFLNTDIVLLKSTNGILIMLTLPSNYIFNDNNLLDEIDVYLPYESSIIWGTSTNDSFSENHVTATIVFIGKSDKYPKL
ncbi:MAG: hypothetical protein KAI79_04965 [Bacteroidales bacterium]|nr:hypothetical protein [Bacteroidales bacterium]